MIILLSGSLGTVLGNYVEYAILKRSHSESVPEEQPDPEPSEVDSIDRPHDQNQREQIVISADPGGYYSVYDPMRDLVSVGETREEAIAMFSDLMELAQETEQDESGMDDAEPPNAPWFDENQSDLK